MNRVETCRHERSAGVESPSRFPIEREVRGWYVKEHNNPGLLVGSNNSFDSYAEKNPVRTSAERNENFV